MNEKGRRHRREWLRDFLDTMLFRLGYRLEKVTCDGETYWLRGDEAIPEAVIEDLAGPAMLVFSLTWDPDVISLPDVVTVMTCPDCQGREIVADWTIRKGCDDPVDMALKLMM